MRSTEMYGFVRAFQSRVGSASRCRRSCDDVPVRFSRVRIGVVGDRLIHRVQLKVFVDRHGQRMVPRDIVDRRWRIINRQGIRIVPQIVARPIRGTRWDRIRFRDDSSRRGSLITIPSGRLICVPRCRIGGTQRRRRSDLDLTVRVRWSHRFRTPFALMIVFPAAPVSSGPITA